eukprot:m.578157 g.578157  ORF g.578157 m.578157 type:complete len:925 (-) comp57917_c0_seq2:1091-3865(-)
MEYNADTDYVLPDHTFRTPSIASSMSTANTTLTRSTSSSSTLTRNASKLSDSRPASMAVEESQSLYQNVGHDDQPKIDFKSIYGVFVETKPRSGSSTPAQTSRPTSVAAQEFGGQYLPFDPAPAKAATIARPSNVAPSQPQKKNVPPPAGEGRPRPPVPSVTANSEFGGQYVEADELTPAKSGVRPGPPASLQRTQSQKSTPAPIGAGKPRPMSTAGIVTVNEDFGGQYVPPDELKPAKPITPASRSVQPPIPASQDFGGQYMPFAPAAVKVEPDFGGFYQNILKPVSTREQPKPTPALHEVAEQGMYEAESPDMKRRQPPLSDVAEQGMYELDSPVAKRKAAPGPRSSHPQEEQEIYSDFREVPNALKKGPSLPSQPPISQPLHQVEEDIYGYENQKPTKPATTASLSFSAELSSSPAQPAHFQDTLGEDIYGYENQKSTPRAAPVVTPQSAIPQPVPQTSTSHFPSAPLHSAHAASEDIYGYDNDSLKPKPSIVPVTQAAPQAAPQGISARFSSAAVPAAPAVAVTKNPFAMGNQRKPSPQDAPAPQEPPSLMSASAPVAVSSSPVSVKKLAEPINLRSQSTQSPSITALYKPVDSVAVKPSSVSQSSPSAPLPTANGTPSSGSQPQAQSQTQAQPQLLPIATNPAQQALPEPSDSQVAARGIKASPFLVNSSPARYFKPAPKPLVQPAPKLIKPEPIPEPEPVQEDEEKFGFDDDLDEPVPDNSQWIREIAKATRSRLAANTGVVIDIQEARRREKELAIEREKPSALPATTLTAAEQRDRKRQEDLKLQREAREAAERVKLEQRARMLEIAAERSRQELEKRRVQEAKRKEEEKLKKKETKQTSTLANVRSKMFKSAQVASERKTTTGPLNDPRFLKCERGEAFDIFQRLPDGTMTVKRVLTGEMGLLPPDVFIAFDAFL